MERTRARAGLVLAATLLAAVLAACGSNPDDEPGAGAPTTEAPVPGDASTGSSTTVSGPDGAEPENLIEVRVSGGAAEVVEGEPAVSLGEEVVLRFSSDVADQVHVHGYDRFVNVAPGQVAELRFVADLPGVWEVELEGAGVELLQLQVS